MSPESMGEHNAMPIRLAAAAELMEAAIENVKAWFWLNAHWGCGSKVVNGDGIYDKLAEIAQGAHSRQEDAVIAYEQAMGDI